MACSSLDLLFIALSTLKAQSYCQKYPPTAYCPNYHSFCSFSSLVYNVLLHDFTTFCTQTHRLVLAHVQSYFDYFLVAVISQIAWGKWLYFVYLYPNAMSPHSTNRDDWKNVGSFYYSYGIYYIEPTFFQVFFPILPSFFLWISCALLKNKYSQ